MKSMRFIFQDTEKQKFEFSRALFAFENNNKKMKTLLRKIADKIDNIAKNDKI